MNVEVPDKTVFIYVSRGNVVNMLGIAQNLGDEVCRISELKLAEVISNFDKEKHCFLTRASDAEMCLSLFGEGYAGIGRTPDIIEIVKREKTIKSIRRTGYTRKKTRQIANQLTIEGLIKTGKEILEEK